MSFSCAADEAGPLASGLGSCLLPPAQGTRFKKRSHCTPKNQQLKAASRTCRCTAPPVVEDGQERVTHGHCVLYVAACGLLPDRGIEVPSSLASEGQTALAPRSKKTSYVTRRSSVTHIK